MRSRARARHRYLAIYSEDPLTHFFLDKAHERSVNADIPIEILSHTIQLRQDLYMEQQTKRLSGVVTALESEISPLKLVLVNVTFRVNDFVGGKLFSEPPLVINVETRQFAVTSQFLKRTKIVDYIGRAYKKIIVPRQMSRNFVGKGVYMREIDEEFDGHSVGQTDRLCTYDEDPGDPVDYIGNAMNHASLKAAFEALAGRNHLNQRSAHINAAVGDKATISRQLETETEQFDYG
ncbi:hypothetical protein Syun_001153 [Stephania yunnanensis]|uniref:Uncharacterized protein n=1 Tax=Stephania yunnanensis TaxID=152371 RepID=A0AAP0Q6U3_9MAGN